MNDAVGMVRGRWDGGVGAVGEGVAGCLGGGLRTLPGLGGLLDPTTDPCTPPAHRGEHRQDRRDRPY